MITQQKQVNGITITKTTALDDREWFGSYSTGEWYQDTFTYYYTDGECRKLEALRAQYRIPSLPQFLPPLPWEPEQVATHQAKVRAAEHAYKEECEANREIIERHGELSSAIDSRREYLADLFNSQ